MRMIKAFIGGMLLTAATSNLNAAEEKSTNESKDNKRLLSLDTKLDAGAETYHVPSSSPHGTRFIDVPASVYRLDAAELRERQQAANLADALRQTPGVFVQKTGPGRSQPIIRGFSISRSVILADGVRLNTPILREGPNEYWNTLDPFAYENLEVILGPGALMYGSDAIGGVVLAGSAPLPRGEKDAGVQWGGGKALLRYHSAYNSFSEHIRSTILFDDDTAFRLGLTRQDFDNLRGANSYKLSHSDWQEQGAYARFEHDITSHSKIKAGWDYYLVDDTNRVHKTPHGQSFRGTALGTKSDDYFRYQDFRRDSAFLRYEFRDGSGFISEADLGVSWQYLGEQYRRLRADGSIRDDKNYDVNSLGVNLRLKTETDWVDFTYGYDFQYNWIKSSGTSKGVKLVQGVVADDSTYATHGLYLMAEIPLQKEGGLHFDLGTRLERVTLNANKVKTVGSLSGSWTELLFSGHLVYDFDGASSIWAGVTQGFRAPNLSDTTRDDEFASSGTEVPTSDLDAEHYTTFELGAKVARADWDLQASIYTTQIRDIIARQSKAKKNMRYSYTYGFELAGSYDFNENWSAFANFSYVDGQTQDYLNNDVTQQVIDTQFSKVPPLQGSFGIRYDQGSKWWVEAYSDWADQQDDLSQDDRTDIQRIPSEGTPGWMTVNLRGGYKFNDSLNGTLSLNNLTDANYRIHGSGQNEAGRNILLQLEYKF